MAIDDNSIAFLAAARGGGVSFASTATMGRQAVLISRRALVAAYRVAGCHPPQHQFDRVTRGWAEPILRDFGALEIVSVDAAPYEGASIVHDLNEEIPDSLADRFSVVIDVGTLEHVFNVPVAIRSYMRMVAVGGHLLLITPTNNEAGHGLYQFSPELFYRVFSRHYGFELQEMLLLELGTFRPRWYSVSDPAVVGMRAQFRSQRPTYLFIRAHRVGSVTRFDRQLQQSDYAAQWQGSRRPVAGAPRSERISRRVAARLPALKHLYQRWFSRQRSLQARADYTEMPSHFSRVSGPTYRRSRGNGPQA